MRSCVCVYGSACVACVLYFEVRVWWSLVFLCVYVFTAVILELKCTTEIYRLCQSAAPRERRVVGRGGTGFMLLCGSTVFLLFYRCVGSPMDGGVDTPPPSLFLLLLLWVVLMYDREKQNQPQLLPFAVCPEGRNALA